MNQVKNEEFWNALSHGAGVVLALIGLIALLIADQNKTPYSTFSVMVYALSAVVLYSSSTIYHAITKSKLKRFWRKIDHISIYFLIAGTYTPLALITLEKNSGWTIFWTVWAIAGLGTILKIFFTGKFETLSTLLYLAMGWLIVFDLNTLNSLMSERGMLLLSLGGAFYTIGIVFYALKKIPFNHAIWHLFVLGGSISHFFMIFLEVI